MVNPCESHDSSTPSQMHSQRALQAKGRGSLVAHFAAYVCVAIILLAIMGCVWAVNESRRPGASSEVLMILPGMGCFSLYAGISVLACTIIAWRRMSCLERIAGCSFVAIGIGMLPTLMALEFLGLLY